MPLSSGNASFRGLLDAECEQAAGVFAAVKDAGMWVVVLPSGQANLRLLPPHRSVADVYAGIPYG